jgi:hypothetical protein
MGTDAKNPPFRATIKTVKLITHGGLFQQRLGCSVFDVTMPLYIWIRLI